MSPPDDQTPADGPKMAGFDRARMPKAVSMKDPSMGERRRRTREGRERRRARQRRRRVLIFTSAGAVFLTMIGMTVLKVIERNRETADLAGRNGPGEGESNSVSEVQDAAPAGAAKGGAAPGGEAKVVPTQLEIARDHYLQRSGSGAADTGPNSKGAEGAEGAAARLRGDREAVDTGGVSEAERERVLRQVLPYYRSSKRRDAPPVPAEELYIPDPAKSKSKK